jgi:hypothetical protein
MNHLTTKEVFQIVDGTLANGERSRLLVHLESCPRCRKDVEVHKNVGRVLRQSPLASPSKQFTAGVMSKIVPVKKSFASVIVNNLGNIFAMALVLSVVWYAVSLAPQAKIQSEPSAVSKALSLYMEYYAKARDVFVRGDVTAAGVQQPQQERPSKANEIAGMTMLSLLILAGIDRFVGRRVVRLRR